MKHLLLWGMAISLVCVLGCGGEAKGPEADAPAVESAAVAAPAEAPAIVTDAVFAAKSSSEQREDITAGMNAFGFDLYPHVTEGEDNVCYSPTSLAFVLTMAYAGARGNTALEMADVLHLPQVAPDDTDFHFLYEELIDDLVSHAGDKNILTIANGVWPQAGLATNKYFVLLMTEHYRAGFQPLDFARQPEEARALINRWGDTHTNGRIPEVLDAGTITPQTVLVLTNAAYFNMEWETRFSENETEELPFYPAPSKTFNVPTMIQKGSQRYFETDGYQALELDYDNDDFSMVLLLPRAKDGLSALDADLEGALDDALEGFAKRNVHIFLPRFTVRSSYRLEEMLAAMGMASAFQPGVADFSGIVGAPGEIWVDCVVQKTFLDVTERGTEAAVVSSLYMMRGSGHSPPAEFVEFRADHPFVYLIRHKGSGAILFMGRVMDPSAG